MAYQRTPKEYACVQRTKKSFETALVNLSKRYSQNKITVKLLCDEAGLSRNAFYCHYRDIFDLYDSIETDIINGLSERFDDFHKIPFPENFYEIIGFLTDYFWLHRDETLMLLDRSVDFKNSVIQIFMDFYLEFFESVQKEKFRYTYEIFYRYVSGGYYTILTEWLRSPGDISKHQFKRTALFLVRRMMEGGNA